ncbi:LETM1 domain-containing protein ylh47 [Naganishia albida]|nr:LETM1 domain-containing protein ylh47 [Naganishia albida]
MHRLTSASSAYSTVMNRLTQEKTLTMATRLASTSAVQSSLSAQTAIRRTRPYTRFSRGVSALQYASAVSHRPTRLSLSRNAQDSRVIASIPLQSLRFASSSSPTPSTQQTSSETTVVDPSKTSSTASVPAVDKSKLPFRQRAWATIKKEAAHYWAGTKLLGKEIKISSKITWKVLNGGQLTRRERRQLRRTTTDLLRLIPFSVFVIVPFMEILLPVALKLFPNMLPSTFEGKLAADEKQRRLLRVRIEMAKFLQETISESGLKAEGVVGSEEFKEFFRKVRSTGESASPEDIIKVAKMFEDDFTLDNLSRPQLVSMCRYMNINAFGTDNFLKHQIRARLEKIRVDDMMIHAEGIDSLSTKELQQACQSRAIRVTGVSPTRLRQELEQWIDLHYTNKISGVLLVLSRAFNFEQSDGVFKSLEATLSSLPENLLNEAELTVSGDAASYKEKLEVLQEQQELIEDEAEQEQEENEAREKARREREEKEKSKREEEARKAREMLPADELAEPATVEAASDGRMTKEQLGELAEALSILSAKSSIVKEKEELKQLMETNISSEEESKLHPSEQDTAQVSLNKRIRSMIKKIDNQLETYDERVGSSLNTIQCNGQGQIAVEDLKTAMKVIKHRPDDQTIDSVVKKLDVDQDGYVVLDHVVELTQDMGLGIVIDDDAKKILNKGAEIKEAQPLKPRKEDIISD